jgi:uncharacterized membrane protein YfcA
MILDWFPFGAEFAVLAAAAFFAGMVDAVVGGGGLIQIPVLLSSFPQAAIPTLFGTNKMASIAGTSVAMWRYGRTVPIPWRVVLPATAAALVGAWAGAALVAWLPRDWMRPLVLVLMIGAAVYTFHNKDFGHAVTREHRPGDFWGGAVLGLAIGLYDGFFGPGTGSFLLFAFVRLFGMDFLRATASAKVVNVATNLSAIAFFASSGPLLWQLGLAMAVCNLAGAQVGSALAIRHGSAFIRKAFLAVVVVLIAKLGWDVVRSVLG